MKRILLFTLFLFSAICFAQKEANIWYFGDKAGLDFNSGTPVVLHDSQMETDEGCASISDSAGNLLFYTDGVTVWNRNHQVMPNGTGLLGSFTATQSGIIIPKPNDSNIYYIFTVDKQVEPNGLNYSEIDIRLNNGLGDVTVNKNISLLTPTTEKITAVLHQNGRDIWVITHGWLNNNFYSYLVSSSGVNTTPVISSSGTVVEGFNNFSGVIKASPNGENIVVCNNNSHAELFDFNNADGTFSNPITLNTRFGNYGAEFSPSGELLYISDVFRIHQYNLKAANISTSETTIYTIDNIFDSFGQLQLGPDNKIYVANYIHDYLSVINNPDFLGLSCNYQHDAILLSPGSSNFGLPTFIQSYFFTTSIVYENTCFGDTTNFYLATTPDTVVWNFGDPTSGANNTSTLLAPSHIFTKSGTYTVSATATLGTETTIETQEITIYKTPSATKPSNLTVCDSNNDGFFNFNLKNLDAIILNGQNPDDFSVDYYANSTDYDNNTPITDYTNYVNAVAYHEQTIIVSVKNKNNNSCEATTNFTIQVFDSPTPALSTAIPNLSDCDNTSVGIDLDGKITFNLTDRETAILNGQSNSDFLITYYEDDNLTQLINNPTSYTNNTATQRIYAKVENKLNTTCFAKTSFLIEVFELPAINNTVSLKQCDNADINGFSSINLNEAKAKIVSNPENYTITFFEEKAFAESNINAISNLTSYTNQTVSNDVVWARVENSNGCYRVSEINLIVSTTQIPSNFLKTFYNCDDGTDTTDGIATFNFSSVTQEVKDLFPANQQLIVNYYRNEADALAELNAITDITNYQNIGYPNQQDIYIRVDSKLDNDCLGLGHHITLNVETVPVANAVSVNPECDNDRDGVFSFDTSNIQSTIIGSQTNVAVSYFDENSNPLSSPLPNPFITGSQTIKARIVNTTSKDPNGQCYNETTIDFIVNSVPIANTVSPQEQCDDDFDGIADFDTSNIESIILGTQTGMVVKYFDENNNPLPSPLPNPFMTISQRITVRVENPEYAVCYDETTFDFTVREKPDFELEEETIICITNNTSLDITIQNPAGSYFYEWKNENGDVISNNSTANVSKGGIYSVKAISMLGCESEIKNIEVRESSISNITIDNLEIIDDSENNSIRINTQNIGLGNYEFSLIDFDSNIIYDYQETPFFDNLEGGIYTIFIKDINGCGTQSFETSIISYPKFFTPNNDGVNDYWNIKGIGQSFYKDGKVQIFNRYGKLVKILSFKDIGWNGFYNGKKLPSNDYWFYAELTDPKGNIIIRKGYFSLLRK